MLKNCNFISSVLLMYRYRLFPIFDYLMPKTVFKFQNFATFAKINNKIPFGLISH